MAEGPKTHGTLARIGEVVLRRVPRVEGYALRRLAYWGSRFGPEAFVRYSPTLWGMAFALALPAKRRIIRTNLRRVHGPRDWLAEELDALRTFARYAHCLAESLGAERSPYPLNAPAATRDPRLMNELAQGQGVVLVTAHTGLWDVAARALAQGLNVDVMIVMEREADGRARELHESLRSDPRVRIIHVDHPLDGMTLLKHLRRGGIVAIQIDRVPQGMRSVAVDLFGVPFAMPEGPFQLAAIANVALIPVFARRRRYFEYEITLGEPQRLPRRANACDLAAAASAVARDLARFVRSHPNDWFHFDGG